MNITGLIKTLAVQSTSDERVLMSFVQDDQGQALTEARVQAAGCVAADTCLSQQWGWVLEAEIQDQAIRDVLLAITYSEVFGKDYYYLHLVKAWNEVMGRPAA